MEITPVRIRPSGLSVQSSSSGRRGRSQQLTFSAENSQPVEDGEADGRYMTKEHNQEITETMRLEMEYNSLRAWYDREEGGNMMFDADSSLVLLGDEVSFKKKEAELAKRLVRRVETRMTLTRSQKLSQPNSQWEDQQLLRSGAVRGTEVQTEFNNDEVQKVILLVHGKKTA
ncbi:hypothetical protein L1049_006220 [Liquidambar formosana]|uniref:Uncharacterized protein n=1 Tax=Liquidambar formosana TaxID=63359 RepID=A0AAP0WR58_LIQFO